MVNNEISRHLGRTASGELMTPYEAPKQHDPSLLVPIPRALGRSKANISTKRLFGYDVWHAYEFSFLLPNSQPVTGTLKFNFPCLNDVMIESKSFKLYLNSFDFEKFSSVREVVNIIQRELSDFTKSEIHVSFHPADFNLLTSIDKHRNWFPIWNRDNVTIDNKDIQGEITFERKDDGVRSVNADFQKDIAQKFKDVFRKHLAGHRVIQVKGSVEERVETIKKSVREYNAW